MLDHRAPYDHELPPQDEGYDDRLTSARATYRTRKNDPLWRYEGFLDALRDDEDFPDLLWQIVKDHDIVALNVNQAIANYVADEENVDAGEI